MRVDLVLMVTVVAKRIEYLSETKMRQMPTDIFRLGALSPKFYDRPNGRPRTPDYWLATQNPIAASDVEMFGCS